MTPEEIYLQELSTIERIASFVARRNHANQDEVDEFTQEVCVRLFDDDYAIIRKFRDRSSISTYLTTVISHLFHHWRIAQWGKWRPSAEAMRLGPKAVVVERLLTRENYSLDETVKILTTRSDSPYTLGEIEAIYLRLRPRHPRLKIISDDPSAEGIGVEPEAEGRVERRDRERTARTAAEVIDQLTPSIKQLDLLILQMRFGHALTVPEIARRLHLDQKKVYKRLDQLRKILQKRLEAAGVRSADVATLLERGDQELRFGFLHDPRENGDQGPSHGPGDEGVEGGEDDSNDEP
ncbi:MAG TPA: sigma-70 family RNA polymerase sigma factor [Thermoanaerobaculia bacterium]|nr:sigma-70 family RNA polymerase sigma factor [Thermoanaerobaculia bacterium]